MIGDVVEHAIKTVKALPEYESLAIVFSEGRDVETVFDPAKLERALLNLLFNAAEAVPAATGHIEVRVARSSDGTVIEVADNGPGIPAEVASSLFRPFVSHGKEKGIGLGLTVVQTVMQQHGGRVEVVRSGPDGTTFRLTVPDGIPATELP